MMESDKNFSNALIASLILHIIILVKISYSQTQIAKKSIRQLEVSYHTVKPKQEEGKAKPQNVKVLQGKKLSKAAKAFSQKNSFPKELVRDSPKMPAAVKIEQREKPPKLNLDIKKRVTIPVFQSEKMTSPKYRNYNQKIRQLIEDKAYLYVSEKDIIKGEVYLTFVLSADGSLKDIKIIDGRTSADQTLREVGLRSIKDASPFPAFPRDLTYPELSFNVIISFEVDE